MSIAAVKAIEKNIGSCLSLSVYAAIKDGEIDCEYEKVSEYTYQSYDNLIKEKEKQGAGLVQRFKLSDPVKQFMAFFLEKFCEELSSIKITGTDTIETIGARMNAELSDSYGAFLIKICGKEKIYFGNNLKNLTTGFSYFTGLIESKLIGLKQMPEIMKKVTEEFNLFIKSIAFIFAKFICRGKLQINENNFLLVTDLYGLDYFMINEMQLSQREKLTRPKRTAAKKVSTIKPEPFDDAKAIANLQATIEPVAIEPAATSADELLKGI